MTGLASSVVAPLTLALFPLLWPSSRHLAMTATGGGPGHSCGLVSRDDFHYFAYGSNMLQGRLRLFNPTAVLVSAGCLKGYRLAFGQVNSSRWGGAAATIIPSPNEELWGVIWCLKANNRQSLDDQEGVKEGLYSPMEVQVEQKDRGGGEEITCLTYQMNNFNASLTSPLYKEVIIRGARESGLPSEYIKKLDTILTNNFNETTPFTMQIREILLQQQNSTAT